MAPKVSSRKIRKSKFANPQMTKNTVCKKNRLQYINDETFKAVIPVGSRYQADVPGWSSKIQKEYTFEPKWLGANAWQTKHVTPTTVKEDDNAIGKGRSNFCSCSFSGSAECVKLHVRDKINKLMSDLGPAYQEWRFNEMGDMVGNSWNLNKQKKFRSLVTMCNVGSKRTSVLDLGLAHSPSKCRKSVVSYYFNVYVPQRISKKIRSGALEVDSDED